ncbi:MAG TPA: response regulator [Casimicrobiaceae bacterium]|nr:response regulator [Casimicrobiaceae bacterium]
MLASGSAAALAADRASILVVDDRPDKLLALTSVLEELKQHIVTAASGEEALKQVLGQEFAVILLDVNMPGLDGLETAKLIRSRRKSAHTPIIFITADFNDDVHTRRGYALGAVDYIASPVHPDMLRAKVKVFVDLYLLARQAERRALEHLALAEERAARVAAERATHRLAFLARASAVLGGSLDVDATLRELGQLVVPQIADASVLIETDVGEAPRRAPHLALHERGATTNAPLGQPIPPQLTAIIERVATTGVVERFGEGGESASLPFPCGLEARAAIVVPLAVRGRSLAVLVLAMVDSRDFEPDAMSLSKDIAGLAAVALDNALLYQRIQESDRRKNEFLAMLAHELRNPMAPIANAVHVLKTGADPARIDWVGDVIGRQLRQLMRLVDDLLDVSRITRGKIDLKVETLDVTALVEDAIESCRPIIDANKHALAVSLPAESLSVRGDLTRLSQVIGNLVNNAAKYTNPGGRIEVIVAKEGGEVVFRVRDNGVGIARNELASVFEPFTQLERTLDRSQGGLGIGLTLVRRLVEMQGGSVAAQSAGPGRGSEFIVRLPFHAIDKPPATDKLAEAVAVSSIRMQDGRMTVLVVDDNADVAESTAILLRSAGCDVHVAPDGRSALAALDSLHPDAVLLDIGLPGMDGYQVAERMRMRPELQRTLIVAVSGYGQHEHRTRSREAGVDHHLLKPVDPTTVMNLLRNRSPSGDPLPS